MTQFSLIEIEVDSSTYGFVPYDRGQNGAFVFRESGAGVHAPRLIVATAVNDNSSDKLNVQYNVPRTCASDVACDVDKVLGTDLVKTELRFLATTSKADRALQIDKQIALLQELRNLIEDRQVMYS